MGSGLRLNAEAQIEQNYAQRFKEIAQFCRLIAACPRAANALIVPTSHAAVALLTPRARLADARDRA
jgi:hypothetical protein